MFLVALAVLLAQGAAAFHMLLVPHRTCEHGELIEAATPGILRSTPINARLERATADHAGVSQIANGERSSADHDHCDALAVRHRVPEIAAPVAPASLLAVLAPQLCGDRRESRPVSLLSLAPKSSPPAA